MQAPDLYDDVQKQNDSYERRAAELTDTMTSIHQTDFTRWANSHLKIIDKNIKSLKTDLSDGLLLIALIEILLKKRFSFMSPNARPTSRFQKLENVSFALDVLKMEGIKIVNIGPSDIVDSNLKPILGLMWTLILCLSIKPRSGKFIWKSLPKFTNGFFVKFLISFRIGGAIGDDDSVSKAKERLLHWIQSKIPDVQIANLTNDWNSGIAIGALVDACAPGLCPRWTYWNPKNAVLNASKAMALAKRWLNVRLLIRPEEMVNPNVDEQSMMIYLSQYTSAMLKTGAPLRPKNNLNSNSVTREKDNKNEKTKSSEPTASTVESYEMEHSKLKGHEFSINGHMTIFNQEFKNSEKYRSGSANDVESLTTTFTRFGIKPSVNLDLKYKEIVEEISTLSTTDFSACKLFVCVYMSHGHKNGYADAADDIFNLRSTIINPIIENKTLNGIPKIFIMVACRGVTTYEENDNDEYDGRIISGANGVDYGNCIISYSTFEGHVSKRTRNGTYFIQTLCDNINSDNGYTKIHSLFAKVNDKLTETGKQVPVFESSMGDLCLRDLASAPNQLTIRKIKKEKKIRSISSARIGLEVCAADFTPARCRFLAHADKRRRQTQMD